MFRFGVGLMAQFPDERSSVKTADCSPLKFCWPFVEKIEKGRQNYLPANMPHCIVLATCQILLPIT